MPAILKRIGQWINGTTQRRLIFWSIGFWVVSVSILGITFTLVGQNQMLKETRERNVQMASVISRDVNTEIGNIIARTRTFSQHLELIEPSMETQATAMLGLRLSSEDYRSIYYFDSQGRLLLYVNDNMQALSAMKDGSVIATRPPIAVRDEVKNAGNAVEGSNVYLSDVYYTSLDYTPVVYAGIEAVMPSGERRVIVCEVDLGEIWQKIEISTIGQTGMTYAVSHKGIIIVHPEPAYLGRKIADEVTPVLSSYEGLTEYIEPFKKQEVIAAYSPVGGPTGWGIVVEQDKAEAYSTIASTGTLILIIWAALGALGTISIFFLMTGFTRPIKQLTKTARSIARTGKLVKTGMEERSDEVGQLSQALDQMIEQVNEAQKAKEEATIAERTRLARELHDAVSQTLFSASLIADVLPKLWEKNPEEGRRRLEEIRQLTRGALAEMRTLLFELRPAALVDVNTEDLLKQLVQAMIGRSRIPVLLKVSGKCELPPEVKISLYRICQEALNNIAKHAGASEAGIEMTCEEGRVELVITDNGEGFDMSSTRPGSLGLGIMKERAGSIGARLTISSQKGKGTRVEAVWENREKGGNMTELNQIRVLLVDDHVVVRSGLGAVLMSHDDLVLTGEAGNGKEAVQMCEKQHPDVVLMDIMMPVMDGVEATKAIHEKWPEIRIIALTSYKEKDMVEGALKAGALSYLLKNVTADELVGAIKGAMTGQPKLSPEAAQILIQEMKQPGNSTFDLTEREKEILILMADGLANTAIADKLVVSHSTVKFHVSNILSKLQVTSRTEAVALALKSKLVK